MCVYIYIYSCTNTMSTYIHRKRICPDLVSVALAGSGNPQEGPRRPQGAPRRPQRAPGGLRRPGRAPQDGPHGPKMALDGPKRAYRRPKRPPGGPKRARRGVPRELREATFFNFLLVFEGFSRFRFFSFPTLHDGPRGPQDRPEEA